MSNKATYPDVDSKIEHLLQSKDEIFKQLIRNSFDMIVLLDAEGHQKYVSESCEKILGYTPEELINISVIEEMLHPDDWAIARKGLQGIVDNSKNGGTQYRHRHKNGGWVYLEAFGTNQLDNPSIQCVVLNVRDITERKKAEEALKESETRLSTLLAGKDRFFSIIGHDLKNPFSSILGFSELLVDQLQKKEYEEAEEYARIIQHSSKQVLDLLSNLLVWAQSQTDTTEYNPETFELKAVVDEVIDLLSNSLQYKSILITNNILPNLSLFADKAMITLVLRNLISNGIKFTHSGGKIQIQAEESDRQLTVSVADNGVGIKEENLTELFNTETRYSTRGTNSESGTGLGLLLCKDFIEIHGGKIWVESSVNNGSTFRFTIPRE